MDKKKQFRIGNVVIKDMKRFGIAIGVLIGIIIFICIIISSIVGGKYDEGDISSVNAKKYSNEIMSKYESSEMKTLFIKDHNNVQNAVGMYIMNNSTMEEDSFSSIISKLQKVLKSDDFSSLNIEKPSTWNGDWKIDNDGNVKFKFSIKDIEPSWINDIDVSSKIIFN